MFRTQRQSFVRTLPTVLAVFMTALTVFAMAGCSKSHVGRYSGTEGTTTMTLELKNNDTFTMTISDTSGGQPEVTNGTWKVDGDKIVLEGGLMPIPFVVKDDKLNGPFGMSLTRQ